jgi:hypothetical protein
MKLQIVLLLLISAAAYAQEQQLMVGAQVKFQSPMDMNNDYTQTTTETPGFKDDRTKYHLAYFKLIKFGPQFCMMTYTDKLRRTDPEYDKKELVYKERMRKQSPITLGSNRTWTVSSEEMGLGSQEGRIFHLHSENAQGKIDKIQARCYLASNSLDRVSVEKLLSGPALDEARALDVFKRNGMKITKDGKPLEIKETEKKAQVPAGKPASAPVTGETCEKTAT